MKILVCISHVPDTTSKIDFVDDREFDTSGISFVINPYDEFGLTKSVFIKENNGANITVLCVGDSSCESSLRKALAIGADEAVRIDHIPKDSLNVAKLIYDYIKDKEYDLIITGRESIDYNSGVVPGLISKMLNIPIVNACIGLDIKDNVVHLKREIDGGTEVLESNFPILIAGQKGLVEEKDLKIPSMRGIMMARKKTLSIVKPENDLQSSLKLNKYEKPIVKASCKMVDSNNIEELVELLHKEAKVI